MVQHENSLEIFGTLRSYSLIRSGIAVTNMRRSVSKFSHSGLYLYHSIGGLTYGTAYILPR